MLSTNKNEMLITTCLALIARAKHMLKTAKLNLQRAGVDDPEPLDYIDEAINAIELVEDCQP